MQGGNHFIEPVDAIVNGSVGAGGIPKVGWIGVGCRLEIMANKGIASTSPIQSIDVDHQLAIKPKAVVASAM